MRPEIGILQERLNIPCRLGNSGDTEHPTVQPILNALAIRQDDVVVEIGAGDGHFSIPIAGQLKTTGGSGVIFACDFSETLAKSLDEAAAHHGVDDRLRAICLTAQKARVLPFGNEQVTRVLSVNAIQYFVDPRRYLADVARILSPRGSLLLADWRPQKYPTAGERPAIGLVPEALNPLLENAELDIHVVLDLPGYSWAILAMKTHAAS